MTSRFPNLKIDPASWQSRSALVCVLLAVGLAPLVETPGLPAPFRAALLPALDALLLVTLAFLVTRRLRSGGVTGLLLGGPHLAVFALLAWDLFCWRIAPYRAFADAELARLVLCISVYSVTSLLRAAQVPLMVGSLLLFGTGLALYGMTQFGEAQSADVPTVFDHTLGLFGDNENFGSFLMLLLPFSCLLAFDREAQELPRLAWQAVAVVLMVALILTGTRSAWIAASVALALFAHLYFRYLAAPAPRRGRLLAVMPLLLSLGAVLLVGRVGALMSSRAATLGHVSRLFSFTDRVRKTKAASLAAAERPWTGWGLGTWSVRQRQWTGENDDVATVLARHDVWSRGGDQQSLAHDYWAQTLAETGAPGLCLQFAVFFAFLFWSFRLLPTLTASKQSGFLIAGVCAVAGFLVDAFGAPSYNFPGASVLPWFCMSLGVAAGHEEGGHPAPRLTVRDGGLAVFCGAVIALAFLSLGFLQRPH